MNALVAVLIAAAPQPKGGELITEALLKSHIRYLASDALEGRAPGSNGDKLAQLYLSSQLEGLGLKPAGDDGGYLQRVELIGVNGHPDTLELKAPDGGVARLSFKRDFIANSGHQRPTSTIAGRELVFVGYGISAPELEWDDFKGVDVRGKVLVMMNDDPSDDPKLFGGKARLWYGRWDYKYASARAKGAAGALIIHTTPSAGYPWQVVETSWTGTQFDLPDSTGTGIEMVGWLTESTARSVVAMGGKELDVLRAQAQRRDFRPVPLGVMLSTQFSNRIEATHTANVLGVLPGSDPVLSQEWVVVTAHFDHLGVDTTAKPGTDNIYNGAVDNAGGVATMLSVARALAAQPKAPKRSVLFAAVAAEEQGLLGSQHLVAHPPVPPSRMAANINIDGFNIWGKTKDVSVIGYGKSSLDALLAELARAQGRVVRPDALTDRGFFYRSDQFNFAKVGVPAAYFSSGHDFVGKPEGWGRQQHDAWEAQNYHQPSDELTDEWSFAGAVEDARLVYSLLFRVADAQQMPTWTKGDEFEGARRRSLQGASP